MQNQKFDNEYTIEEDADTIRLIVSTSISEAQIGDVLEKISADFHFVQKRLHVQFSKKEFEYRRISIAGKWEKVIEQCVFLLDGQKAFELDVFSKKFLKDIFSIASINTLTEAEKDEIKKGENVWYPTRHHPLRYDVYAKNSVVLRCNGELIGWCIVIPTNSSILLYDNLFVKSEYQSLGRALSLFQYALSIQLNESPFRYITFTVHGENDSLLRVLEKRMKSVIADYQSIVIYQINIR